MCSLTYRKIKALSLALILVAAEGGRILPNGRLHDHSRGRNGVALPSMQEHTGRSSWMPLTAFLLMSSDVGAFNFASGLPGASRQSASSQPSSRRSPNLEGLFAIPHGTASRMPSPTASATAFASKHNSHELDMNSLLEPVERGSLDRTVKIVATLGPASFAREMLVALMKAGVNIFRLNASHRQKGVFENIVPIIREEAAKLGLDVQILGDLQGPKFRCTTTLNDEPVPLEVGTQIQLGLASDDEDATRPGRITLAPTVEQSALMRGLTEGMTLLLDDGNMEIKVVSIASDSEAMVEVVTGGMLKSRKGINVPQLQIDCSALTEKDVDDAKYMLSVGVDYIALSFAQKAADIRELIAIMDAEGVPPEKRPVIVPKIEKPAALKNINEIMELCGGMMVARGDLGVELGLHRTPFAQKFLIRKANQDGKFVITATQMMESMIENAVPTRAEVSDVANAVFDGTDAVMLSGESAMGADPVRVVEWMGKVVAEAEAHADDVSPSF